MEFRRFKHKMYDTQEKRWVTLRNYYVRFITGEASNIISLQPPISDCENTWTFIPTITYRHNISTVPGTSFTLKFKWLKWNILTLSWSRSWKDTKEYLDEEETAEPQTCLDQESWPATIQ